MIIYACLLALLLGAVLAIRAPAGQFVVGLIVVTLAGIVCAALRGLPAGRIALWSGVLFAGAQAGYAVGLGLLALRDLRRTAARRAADPERHPAAVLHRPSSK